MVKILKVITIILLLIIIHLSPRKTIKFFHTVADITQLIIIQLIAISSIQMLIIATTTCIIAITTTEVHTVQIKNFKETILMLKINTF